MYSSFFFSLFFFYSNQTQLRATKSILIRNDRYYCISWRDFKATISRSSITTDEPCRLSLWFIMWTTFRAIFIPSIYLQMSYIYICKKEITKRLILKDIADDVLIHLSLLLLAVSSFQISSVRLSLINRMSRKYIAIFAGNSRSYITELHEVSLYL